MRFGLRTLEWRREQDAFGQSMQCVVNGVPVQTQGANVIPPDFFPVRAEAGWNRVVEDAVAAHMNMVVSGVVRIMETKPFMTSGMSTVCWSGRTS